MSAHPMTVPMLLSCDSFELFFGHVLKLDRQRYLQQYRNDWSWYYARGLADNGLRPILYIPSHHESGLHETDAGVAVRFLPLAKWYRPLASLRRACRATRWSLYAQERLNAMAMMTPLRAALAEDDAKLLYVQEYWTARFDHLVGHLDIPVVGQDQGGNEAGVLTWFKRAAFGSAGACLAQTQIERDRAGRFGGRTALQPNGCDVGHFCPDAAVERGKTILTVARLTDKQKRTSDLIRALTKLPADFSLDIVGTGPDLPVLQALAAELGVADRVRFQGFQDRNAVRDFLRHCGVYAMPSANEAICLALLEAMACGASVVASRIRSFEPLIDDRVNGRLVDVADVDGIAAAIGDAWDRRAEYGVAAVDTVVEGYDSRNLLRQLANRLRDVAGAAPTAGPGLARAMA